MELSPEGLREVEFREKWRGYDPADVDQFIDEVADAVEALQEQLRIALDRAVAAERQAAEAQDEEQTISSRLMLAHRTADLAVREAREQAARVMADAQQRSEKMVAEARETARRLQEDASQRVREDLARLERVRAQLRADVDALDRFFDVERGRLGELVARHLRSLEEEVPAAAMAAAEPVEVALPPAVVSTASGADGEGTTTQPPVDDGAAVHSPAGPERDSAEPDSMTGPEGEPSERQPTGEELLEREPAEQEPAEPEPLVAAHDHGPDDFLAELRQAATDTEPLGPRDHVPPSEHDVPPDFLDDDVAGSGRFGSRLRRRR